MKVTVHSIHFDADKDLIQFVQDKVSKLEQFYDGIIGGEVFLKLDNAENNENKVAEIKLNTKGKDMFAKRQCKSFEEATDEAVEAIRRQLKKHKEKQRAVHI